MVRRARQMAGRWPTTSMRPTTANSEAGVRIRTPWAAMASPPTPRNSASGQHSRMAATSRAAWSSPEASPGDDEDSGGDYLGEGAMGRRPLPLPQTPSPNPHKFLVLVFPME